jgi:hypothetical protein
MYPFLLSIIKQSKVRGFTESSNIKAPSTFISWSSGDASISKSKLRPFGTWTAS